MASNNTNTRKRSSPCEDSAPKRAKDEGSVRLTKNDLQTLVRLAQKFKWLGDGKAMDILNKISVSIGLAGETSSGKTTLLNAILMTWAMPTSKDPCTGYNVRVTTVDPSEMTNKYKLVLPDFGEEIGGPETTPSLSSSQGPVEKIKTFFTGGNTVVTSSNQIHHKVVETDDPEVVSEALKKSFAPHIKGDPAFHKVATLMVSDENALKIVLVDTPGPRLGHASWLKAITQLDNSSHPVIIFPVAANQPDICKGPLGHLAERPRGELKDMKLIIAFTHIDMLSTDEAEQKLKNAMTYLKAKFGDTILRFAVLQCISPDYPPHEFELHRQREMETISRLPTEILHVPDLIKGVDELREVLMRLYLSRWNEEGLQALGLVIQNEISSKKEILRKKSAVTQPSAIAGKIFQELSGNATLSSRIEDTYTAAIVEKVNLCLTNLDLAPTKPRSRLFSIFGLTKAEQDFKNQDAMRKTIKSILEAAKGHLGNVISAMADCYTGFLEIQLSPYKETCPKLFNEILSVWKAFAERAQDSTVRTSQKGFSAAQASLMLCIQEKTDYPIALPQNGTPDKSNGPIVQEMMTELKFILKMLHFSVLSHFFDDVVSAFPIAVNEHLCDIKEVWYSSSKEEIDCAQNSLIALQDASETLAEIMEIYEGLKKK